MRPVTSGQYPLWSQYRGTNSGGSLQRLLVYFIVLARMPSMKYRKTSVFICVTLGWEVYTTYQLRNIWWSICWIWMGKIIWRVWKMPDDAMPQTGFPKAQVDLSLFALPTSVVLNSSPHISFQTFVLFNRKCPAKWTSQDIPPWFQFEGSVYVPFKLH